ncbi:MAG TPA: amidase [Verrucomicrobiaceae bacterium]
MAKWMVPGLLLVGLETGCVIPQNKSPTKDHAYVKYWDGAKDDTHLRLAVKDVIDMKGEITTAGSEYRAKNSSPARQDAACLRLARQRNVTIVGKANLSEFALRGSGMNDYYGTPVNPLGHDLIPGGSSSGCAVAVANGTADIAFGTDTCGSIRVPAGCCGIAGLKTTFGLVSLKGVFPISPKHLDTVGPMARDVSGLVQGMSLLQEGFESKYQAAIAARPSGKSIRVARLHLDGTDPAIDKAIDDAIAAAGFQVVQLVEEDTTKWGQASSDGQMLARIDAWRYDGEYLDRSGVQRVTKTIIFSGKLPSDEKREKVLTDQVEFKKRLKERFRNVDFVVLPTLKSVPLKKPLLGSNIAFELRVLGMEQTEPVNLVGNPALVIPVPLKDRSVPVTGLQMVGRNFSEADLLNAGRLIEEKVGTGESHKRKHWSLTSRS